MIQRIEYPEDRPVCPSHGCFMKVRRKVDGKRQREFRCPIDGCGEKVYRPVKEFLEQSLQGDLEEATSTPQD